MRKIVPCGSTKFMKAFAEWNARLTMKGNVVYSVAVVTTGNSIDEEHKVLLDYVHMKKIELSDMVFVIDVGGYVGESTSREIKLAAALGKEIQYLSREYPEWTVDDCFWV
jgi:hypothetical protein